MTSKVERLCRDAVVSDTTSAAVSAKAERNKLLAEVTDSTNVNDLKKTLKHIIRRIYRERIRRAKE
jgi:hypothetical protein